MMSLVLIVGMVPSQSFALPTSQKQAERIVVNWLAMDNQPLETSIGSQVSDILTFDDDDAQPLYHIVYLNPQGFVIVAGDDLVEPIIGFAAAGEYDDSLDNPLGALVKQDVPARVMRVREMERQGKAHGTEYLSDKVLGAAKTKWSLLDRDGKAEPIEFGLAAISDVRVAPLLQTKWNQRSESGGNQCYNIYTPSYYPCGCVATAFAQIMRFWEFPTTGVGTTTFNITVNGTADTRNLRGGDDAGGVYQWSWMDVGPSVSVLSHREAIGRLTHDAGISVNMSYASGGSGTDTLKIADAFVNTFNYANAVKGYNSLNNLDTAERNHMVNSNLDAGYPVAFGIRGTVGGHAIVGDGYGYNTSTMYTHLNMGWGSYQDAWYNLPSIDSSPSFTSVYKCVYNIYTSGSGEIISGRVTDDTGTPIIGADVTALRTGGGSYIAVTNSNGIYALTKIPSASTYQVSVSETGYTFDNQSVATLTSTDNATVGNKWAVDFIANGNNPRNFSATPQPAAQIDLSWDQNSSGDDVLLAWSLDGIFRAPVDGTPYSAGDSITGGGTVLYYGTNTSYTHAGLSPSTTYYYKVWSYDAIEYSTGITTDATTLCPLFVSSFPWIENFDDDARLPQCWEEYQRADAAGWQRTTGRYHSSPGSAFHNDDNVNSGVDDWLVSPAFDFSNSTDITLTFWQYQNYASLYEYHGIRVSTDSDGTPGSGTWTEIHTGAGQEDTWQEVVLDLTTYAGETNIHIAFQYTGDDADEWLVDDISITASTTGPQYDLDITLNGSGGGRVTATGIDCPGDCTESYDENSVVNLTATPTAGSRFDGWSGDADCSDGQVTMSAARSCTATFIQQYDLDVTLTGSGSGSVSATGILCPGDCSESFDVDTVVNLTTTAGAGSTFMGWSGDCSGNGSCIVTMDQARNVSATFTDTVVITRTLAVSLTGNGTGGVTSAPVGIFCGTAGATCAAPFDDGVSITLTAAPATGTTFSGWTGDCSGSSPTCNLTMDQVHAATAIFTLQSFDVTVIKAGKGDGTVTSNPAGIDCGIDCSQSYDYGFQVVLTALPDEHSALAGWLGSCNEPLTDPPSPTCTVDILQVEDITVTFAPDFCWPMFLPAITGGER